MTHPGLGTLTALVFVLILVSSVSRNLNCKPGRISGEKGIQKTAGSPREF